MAGGDAFFEEGIHWLHLAGSLGPRITSIQGYRPAASPEGPDRRVKSMMAAFRYDNGAVGSLYYSREIPSLFRGLRVSKLFGRAGIITFESNGLFVVRRGPGLPRVLFPGIADIRGYQAMYRDFVRAIRDGAAPEMSLERAIEDQRLMDRDLREHRAHRAVTEHFDIIIIGSGAGGGTMARALSESSARILILERGDFVAREDQNWNPEAVWKHLRYRTTETWLDESGNTFRPYTHYCVGGNTKFWGTVLYRLRPQDFTETEHLDGTSPAWPIDYETLEPFYDRAERMYHVRGTGWGRSDGGPARAVSARAGRPRAGGGGHRRAAAPAGTASVAAAARAPRRLRPVQHLQLVSVQDSREKRRRGVRRATGHRTAERDAVDQRPGAAADHRRGRAEDRRC